MPLLSLRVSDEDNRLFRDYAKLKGKSLNEFFKESALEKIESEVDLTLYEEALKEFEANPVIHSHEDVKAELGL